MSDIKIFGDKNIAMVFYLWISASSYFEFRTKSEMGYGRLSGKTINR